MNEKNTKILVEKFPSLYAEKRRAKRTPFYLFSFECGDGWFNLIYSLSETLVKLKFNNPILQVKEKFGGLRYYVGGATEEQWRKIDLAEEMSYHICEVCGRTGKDRDYGWIKTLCFIHYFQILWKTRKNKIIYYLFVQPIKYKYKKLKKRFNNEM